MGNPTTAQKQAPQPATIFHTVRIMMVDGQDFEITDAAFSINQNAGGGMVLSIQEVDDGTTHIYQFGPGSVVLGVKGVPSKIERPR